MKNISWTDRLKKEILWHTVKKNKSYTQQNERKLTGVVTYCVIAGKIEGKRR
jgi:hypothetical protein